MEAVHHALKMSEQTHGSRTTKNLGSDEHVNRLKRSAVQFSSMNCGYIRRTKVPRRQARDPHSELQLEAAGNIQQQNLVPTLGEEQDGLVQLVEPDYFSKKIVDMNKPETMAVDPVSVNVDIETLLEPGVPAAVPGQEVDHVTNTTLLTRKTKAELIKVILSNIDCFAGAYSNLLRLSRTAGGFSRRKIRRSRDSRNS